MSDESKVKIATHNRYASHNVGSINPFVD